VRRDVTCVAGWGSGTGPGTGRPPGPVNGPAGPCSPKGEQRKCRQAGSPLSREGDRCGVGIRSSGRRRPGVHIACGDGGCTILPRVARAGGRLDDGRTRRDCSDSARARLAPSRPPGTSPRRAVEAGAAHRRGCGSRACCSQGPAGCAIPARRLSSGRLATTFRRSAPSAGLAGWLARSTASAQLNLLNGWKIVCRHCRLAGLRVACHVEGP
jgi:hypothetical protein